MCLHVNLIVGTQCYYPSIIFQVSMISKEGLHPLSFICSGSEPFRPEEQLLSKEGEIFLLTNLAILHKLCMSLRGLIYYLS